MRYQVLMILTLFVDFIPTDLINGTHQMTDNMELVKNEEGLGGILLNHIDIRTPHIATDAL